MRRIRLQLVWRCANFILVLSCRNRKCASSSFWKRWYRAERVTKETCRVSNANARKLFAMLAEMDPTLNLLKAQLCVEGPTIEKTC